MYIRSSTALRSDYSEIAKLAKETAQPVYITLNGNGDTVIMGMEAFEQREQMLALRERLLLSEKERLRGDTLSLGEAKQRLQGKFNGKI